MIAQAPQRETFAVRLASAAAPAALEAWLAAAAPGHRAEYASGIDLPRGEPGVVLVTAWKDAGLVTTIAQRDPTDARRWQYFAERTSVRHTVFDCSSVRAAARGQAGRASATDAVGRSARQQAALLDLLRARAAKAEPCPSFADTARRLGLGAGRAGTRRAAYLFDRLKDAGLIAVRWDGPGQGRVVTIRAKGRACGKSTGELPRG